MVAIFMSFILGLVLSLSQLSAANAGTNASACASMQSKRDYIKKLFDIGEIEGDPSVAL